MAAESIATEGTEITEGMQIKRPFPAFGVLWAASWSFVQAKFGREQNRPTNRISVCSLFGECGSRDLAWRCGFCGIPAIMAVRSILSKVQNSAASSDSPVLSDARRSGLTPQDDTPQTLDEEAGLIRDARKGDRRAFAALVERYWDRLYRWMFHLRITGRVPRTCARKRS